jgi:uncharacterized membrane protein HdeD (DUF308 family)
MEHSFFNRHLYIAMALGVLLAALGVFMMFQSESFAQVLVAVIGIVLVLSGIYSIGSTRAYAWSKRGRSVYLVKSILSIVVGLLAVTLPLAVATVSWSVLIYLLAAQLAISALISLFNGIVLRNGEISVSPIFVEAFSSLVLALLLFLFPRQIGSMILKIVGFIVFAIGLGLVVWASRIRKLTRQARDQGPIESTAQVLSDSDPRE